MIAYPLKFKPIEKDQLKKGVVIFHKKYGRGTIKDVWSYARSGGSMSVKFDNEEYSKTLFVDSMLSNKSISLISETSKYLKEEYDKELYYGYY